MIEYNDHFGKLFIFHQKPTALILLAATFKTSLNRIETETRSDRKTSLRLGHFSLVHLLKYSLACVDINFHENCQWWGKIIQQFRVLFYCFSRLCFYYERIFGIFESFVLAVCFASHTYSHTYTKSIFSTPNDDESRQWDGKTFIMLYFLLWFSCFLAHTSRYLSHSAKFTTLVRISSMLLFRFMISFKSQRDDVFIVKKQGREKV